MDNFEKQLANICKSILKEATAASISHLYGKDVMSVAENVAAALELKGGEIDENAIFRTMEDLGYASDHEMSNDIFEASAKLLDVDLGESVDEGYTARELTDYDREMLSKEIPGLEGPWRNRADGKYYYYDPKEGRYYDPSTDWYMDKDFKFESVENENPVVFESYSEDDYVQMIEAVEEMVDAGIREDEMSLRLSEMFGEAASSYLPQILRGMQQLDEVAPEGWEGTVKAMKKHDEIDNPWALAWHMKNKGYKSHKKENVEEDRDYYMRETLKRIQTLAGVKK